MGFETRTTNHEQENISNEHHFSADYPNELIENRELTEKANKMADYYLSKINKLDDDNNNDNQLTLIHFSNNHGIEKVQETNLLDNRSNFYDGGTEKLKRLGFRVEDFDEKFGREKCVVAIPKSQFSKWSKSLSWLKIVESGIADNAYVFSVPKDKVLVRDGSTVDRMFAAKMKDDTESVEQARLDYFSSTRHYKDSVISDDSMVEAWIPHKIPLDNATLLKYEEF